MVRLVNNPVTSHNYYFVCWWQVGVLKLLPDICSQYAIFNEDPEDMVLQCSVPVVLGTMNTTLAVLAMLGVGAWYEVRVIEYGRETY